AAAAAVRVDDLVISLSAKGLTHGEICAHLADVYGAQVSKQTVTAITDRGRRPFRPGPDWPTRLGELAYGVYLLADQTGVDVAQVVASTASNLHVHAQQSQAAKETGWPFEAS
ncbi:MAG: hypothetical protein DLM58_02410, partial [Pseudonocardiales bacterium]